MAACNSASVNGITLLVLSAVCLRALEIRREEEEQVPDHRLEVRVLPGTLNSSLATQTRIVQQIQRINEIRWVHELSQAKPTSCSGILKQLTLHLGVGDV